MAVVNLRIDDEMDTFLTKYAEDTGENVSELIRRAINKAYKGELDAKKVGGIVATKLPERLPVGGLIVPVGDVICAGTGYEQTQLWWVERDKIPRVRALAKDWVELGGFKFCVGVRGGGGWYLPEVIEDEKQERRRNGQFCISTRGAEARVGDTMVWLEIDEPDEALRFMRERTDIPCAVRCDANRYGVDKGYTAAFDRANALFIHYYVNGRPRRADTTTTISDEDVGIMFDV